jgi:hypothetical protein
VLRTHGAVRARCAPVRPCVHSLGAVEARGGLCSFKMALKACGARLHSRRRRRVRLSASGRRGSACVMSIRNRRRVAGQKREQARASPWRCGCLPPARLHREQKLMPRVQTMEHLSAARYEARQHSQDDHRRAHCICCAAIRLRRRRRLSTSQRHGSASVRV